MSAQRRLYLRASLKLMAGIAVVVLLGLFLSARERPNPPKPIDPTRIDLADIVPGQMVISDWGTRKIVILHRSVETIEALSHGNDALLDPDSDNATQPAAAKNAYRSLQPAYFIAIAYGTDMGCPLRHAPASEPAPVSPWYGGFQDQCRGSWYDPAGRVYREQAAVRNLVVPPYRYLSPGVVEIGVAP